MTAVSFFLPSQDVLTPHQLRVLLAIVKLHREDGRVTVRAIQDEIGLLSPSTVHAHLHRLRNKRFVDWDEGKAATIRPLVDVVAHG